MKRKMAAVWVSLALCLTFAAGCDHTPELVQTELSVESSIESTESTETTETNKSIDITVEPSEELPPEPSKPREATEEDLAVIQDYDTKYFVKKLTGVEKYWFVELYRAAINFEKTATFETPPSEDELTKLMILLNYDCPELIQLSGDYFPEYGGDDLNSVTAVGLSYCMKEKEYTEGWKKLDTFYKIIKQKTEGKTDYEKELIVYDWLFHNCVYQEDGDYVGSIYGALVDNTARCEGFSKAFEWCMRKLGIECMALYGTQSFNLSSSFLAHSWNIIRLDGNYYQVDLTVDNTQRDDTKSFPPNYGCLNLPDSMILSKREIDPSVRSLGVPVCSGTKYCYHMMNGSFIKSGEASREQLIEMMKTYDTPEGMKTMAVKYESAEDYKAALDYAREAADLFKEKYAQVKDDYVIYYSEVGQTITIQRMSSTQITSRG